MSILTNQRRARKVETQNRDQIDVLPFSVLGKSETTKFPDPNTTIYRVRFQTNIYRVFHSDSGMGWDLSPPSGWGHMGGGQKLDGGGFVRDSQHV